MIDGPFRLPLVLRGKIELSAPRNPSTRSRKSDEPGVEGWSANEAYGDLEGYLDDIERQVLSAALEESRWNKTATAKLLGISFRSLW